MAQDETQPRQYAADAPSALICDENPQRRALEASALNALGYKTDTAETVEQLYESSKYTEYALVLLSETFGGNADNNEALDFFQYMPIAKRRRLFVALVSATAKTFDNMTAFSKSVNMIINTKDVPEIQAVLKKGVADNDLFYRVFRDILREQGKQ